MDKIRDLYINNCCHCLPPTKRSLGATRLNNPGQIKLERMKQRKKLSETRNKAKGKLV